MSEEYTLRICGKFDIHERIAEGLNRQIISDGLIPPPIPEHWVFDTTMPPRDEDYIWPEQQRARIFNPNPTNQDRFYLFIFLWRNMVNNPEKLHEYMTWFVQKKDPCVNNPAGIERHINQMIHTIKYPEQNKKQWDLFNRIRYYSLVEHVVIDPDAQSIMMKHMHNELARGGSGHDLPATLPLYEDIPGNPDEVTNEVSNPEALLTPEEPPKNDAVADYQTMLEQQEVKRFIIKSLREKYPLRGQEIKDMAVEWGIEERNTTPAVSTTKLRRFPGGKGIERVNKKMREEEEE